MKNRIGQSVVGMLGEKETVITPSIVEEDGIQVVVITADKTTIKVPALQFDSAYRTAQQRRNAEMQAAREASKE